MKPEVKQFKTSPIRIIDNQASDPYQRKRIFRAKLDWQFGNLPNNVDATTKQCINRPWNIHAQYTAGLNLPKFQDHLPIKKIFGENNFPKECDIDN